MTPANDADAFALRLYSRIPAHYRFYDAENHYPLLALIRVIGAQAANLRQDLQALWEDFFIETCADWAVPYIGALVSAEPLPRRVPQSDRLNVWNTVRWRRGRGSTTTLREVAGEISGWPAETAEMFRHLAANERVDVLRRDGPTTPDLHEGNLLDLLDNPRTAVAHTIDVRGHFAPGVYEVVVRRLQTFALQGVTSAVLGAPEDDELSGACFTFDPVGRNTPLFARQSAAPITRSAFFDSPWSTFGTEVGVRQHGVLLASGSEPRPPAPERQAVSGWGIATWPPTPVVINAAAPFDFDVEEYASLRLRREDGLQLVEPRPAELGGVQFLISAEWRETDADGREAVRNLGTLTTRLAARDPAAGFRRGRGRITRGGRLTITLAADPGERTTPPPPVVQLPAAVLRFRLERSGVQRNQDAAYVFLPPSWVRPGQQLTFQVTADGSTHSDSRRGQAALRRTAEGQVYPPRQLGTDTRPVTQFTALDPSAGLVVVDRDRFGQGGQHGAALFEAGMIDTEGAFWALGGIATGERVAANVPELAVRGEWPAFTFARPAAGATEPANGGLLCIQVRALRGDALPATELVVVGWDGSSILAYLPALHGFETAGAPAAMRLLVAQDGSTYFDPGARALAPLSRESYGGLLLARASAGQVLPIPGEWPLRQRIPEARDLGHCEEHARVEPGVLAIDPELGRFALPAGDPALRQGALTVDYVEAFSERVGARTFDQRLGEQLSPATRFVRKSGAQASWTGQASGGHPVHPSLEDALRLAQDGDVIEIVDSATYSSRGLRFPVRVHTITIRAAPGQRPCLNFGSTDVDAGLTAADTSLRIGPSVAHLEFRGLLISGGPLRLVSGRTERVRLVACTVAAASAASPESILASDVDDEPGCVVELVRCIVGGLALGASVRQLRMSDSIVDNRPHLAIRGRPVRQATTATPPVRSVCLDRVTVLGDVHCDNMVASDCLFVDRVVVEDRQSGYIRFSRAAPGSELPCRYHCLPPSAAASAGPMRPLFMSRNPEQSAYCQLADAGPPELLHGAEDGGEIGAFATALTTARLENLNAKLSELLPAGMTSLVVTAT